MSQQSIKLAIHAGGTIEAIYLDELAPLIELGAATVERASDVEPVRGGWAAFMRCTYPGHLPGDACGAVLGPYRLRSEALAAEVEYLEGRLFGVAVEDGNLGVVEPAGGLKNPSTGL